MEYNFNLGIEISEDVSKTMTPQKIKRYGAVGKKPIKVGNTIKNKFYRYRPGVNAFMTGDLDV